MRATAAGSDPLRSTAIARWTLPQLFGASPVAAALMSTRLPRRTRCAQSSSPTASCARPIETLDQLGSLGWVSHHGALVRLSRVSPAWPSVQLREAVDRLAWMGDGELLATTLAMLAQAVYAQVKSTRPSSCAGWRPAQAHPTTSSPK